ncbi:MAG: hypothetical protein JNL58_21885 [Planctomyces sp.]|nr:hypothetical protein [Planctomyces sp.]
MARILAITWTAQTLRHVLAETAARGKVSIVDAGQSDVGLEPDQRQAIGNGIQAIVSRLKAEKARLLILVNRGSVDSATFDVPPADDHELPALVQNLAIRDIPGATEDTTVDFIAYPRRADGSRSISAMAMVAENQLLLRQILEQSGSRLIRVLISTHPLRAFSPATIAPTSGEDGELDRANLIVSRGQDAADVLLCSHRVPILSRTLRLAANVPDAEITRYLRTEVQRTLISAGGQLPRPVHIENVHVIGNARQTAGLEAALAAQFQVAATVHQPSSVVPNLEPGAFAETIDSGDFAPLLAAISEESAAVSPALDFANPRKPPVQASRTKQLIAAAVVLVSIVSGAGYYVWSQLNEIDEEIARLVARRNELNQIVKDTEGKRQLAASLKTWENNRFSWPDELRDLTERIPSSPELVIQQLTVSPAGSGTAVASFRGIGKQPEVISQMETSLRDKYHDIQIPAVREVQEGSKVLSAFSATLKIRSRPLSQFQELLKPEQLSADQSSSTVAEKRRTTP